MSNIETPAGLQPFLTAEGYDHLAMLNGAQAAISTLFGGELSLLHPVEAARLAKGKPRIAAKAAKPSMAINDGELVMDVNIVKIDVSGIILHKASFWESFYDITSYETLQGQIAAAIGHPKVNGILLDINSPGGMVAGCWDFCDWLVAQKSHKPIHAIARDSAYSAAYAIASCADHITVTKSGGIGSIGVIMTLVEYSKWMEKEGIAVVEIFAGDKKNFGTPFAPLSDAAKTDFQADVNTLYGMFVAHVAAQRELDVEVVKATQAGCYRAGAGVAAGLADAIGNIDAAVETLFAAISG